MIRCAVIGVGYIGRMHAQKYKLLQNVKLVAICDINVKRCKIISKELNVPSYLDYRYLFNQVDAVSIAVAASDHYKITKEFLIRGIHVLVEKPITKTVKEANELINLAKKNNCKLQVGHLERFNIAFLIAKKYIQHPPLFIKSNRFSTFHSRCKDINVVLDLMIHDINIIQTIVKSSIVNIDAIGSKILSKSIDIANARITFENYCVANITASRIHYRTERKFYIFQPKSYILIDLRNSKFFLFKKDIKNNFYPKIIKYKKNLEKTDTLLEEIKSFLLCIEKDTSPIVTGEEGRDALEIATKITSLINTI